MQTQPTLAEQPGLGYILVVDDDPDLRFTIRWALEDEGFQVETAADGQEAIERGMKTRPALLVLDMGLPIVNGDGVAARLRNELGFGLPILVITADGHASEKAARVGAFDYLHKPFDLEALVRSVHRGLA
ncbi:MAG TPA: response regulator transcription factor [Chloroflexota bacterium]